VGYKKGVMGANGLQRFCGAVHTDIFLDSNFYTAWV